MVRNILRKLIYVVFLIPLFYLPGIVGYTEAGSKAAIFFLLAGIIFFLFAYFLFKGGTFRYGPMVIIAGIYAGVLALSTVFSFDMADSFWGGARDMNGLLLYLCLIGFFLVLSCVIQNQREWEKLFSFCVGVGLIVTLVGYLQIFEVLEFPRRGSLMGNTSFMGTYLIFTVFLAVYLAFKKKEWIYLGGAVPMIALMYFFNSMAALAGSLGGLALFFLLWLAFKAEKENIRKIGKAVLGISVSLVVFASFLVFHPVRGGLFEGPLGRAESSLRTGFHEASSGMRYIFWEQSVKGFRERPILGWGLNSFQHVFFRHYDAELLVSSGSDRPGIWSRDPHNVIYEKLASTGIMGLLAHLSLIMGSLVLLWRSYRKKRVGFYAPAVFTAMITAYFAQQLTVYDTYSSMIMLFLFFGFVNFYSHSKEIKPQICGRLKLPLIMAVVAVLSGFLICNGFYKPIRANYFLTWALVEEDPEMRIKVSRAVINLSDFDRGNARYVLSRSARYYLERAFWVSKEERKEVIDFFAEELREESPSNDFLIVMEKARYFAAQGNIEEAEKALLKASAISPRNPRPLYFLAEVEVGRGNFEKAIEIIEEFINLEPRLEHSYRAAAGLACKMENEELKKDIEERWEEVQSRM